MLNQEPFDYEEPDFNPVQAFNKIKKFLDKFDHNDWENPHKYIIEEYFPNESKTYYSNTYELSNIKMDIEKDGVAYISDAEGILEEAMFNSTPLPLQAIIMDEVTDASISDYYKWITLTFEDGYIRIKY